ncbi:aminoglycoside 6-adenylyltransferase [Myxosarcina sp. GI1(2024)]
MSFNSEKLNAARQRLLDKVIEYFLAKKGIEAIYIQGSVASGLTDEFSDIDLRVVIQPEIYEQYILERFSAPHHWGEWLYNEWSSSSWICVSHFKPFNKIDVLYFKPEELQPSPWFLLPTQVIYDPKDLVKQVIQVSKQFKFTLLKIEEVDRLISKGLAYAEEVYRRVIRKELFYAQSLLDNFRWVLIQFDDYFQNSLPSSGFGSPSHFEQRGSKELIEVLKLSYTLLDKQSILHALGKLLGVYQDQVIQLYETLPLKRDKKADLYWINNLFKLCKSL